MTLSVFDAAREQPRREAVVVGEVVLDYATLAEQVRAVMDEVDRACVGRDVGHPVALVARPALREVLLTLALIELRWPWLALHSRLTEGERARLVRLAGAQWLIDGTSIQELPWTAPASQLAPDTIAVLATSGTTGRPKLAMLPRRAWVASAEASGANLGWREDDRWLLCMPLAHVGGLSVVTRCVHARRAVVLMDDGRFGADAVIEAVERRRVTLLSVVPTMLHRMLARSPSWAPPRWLRAILLGGAAASPLLLRRAAAAGWPILTTYGLTEACSQVTTQRYGTTQQGEAGEGVVLEGVEVSVDDGRVLVRGSTMMSGYLGEAAPFDAEGWFATGDCGRWDDAGNLHILGRRTDLIVTGGENVYPAEVEAALEECPGVSAACVFGVPDEEWGQLVAAAVVGTVTVASIAQFAAERLAPHKRPRLVSICGDLRWTASGKLDRAATARAAVSGLRRADSSA